MSLKSFLIFLFVFVGAISLIIYWFVPLGKIEFSGYSEDNFNFSISNSTSGMQFYENLRYQDSQISYKIHDCPYFKESTLERAFEFIENRTILDFYLVSSDEEISVYCNERSKPSTEGFFIAGEGGPVKITRLEDFNVIFNGEIVLIRESDCPNPNVGIHELLHALGFDHSDNPKNIMYPTTRCDQEIGDEIINEIDRIYAQAPYPDLAFEEVSAEMNGKYLDTTISIRNYGLLDSEKANLIIYADGKKVKEFEFNSMEVGFGTSIELTNIWVNKISVDELTFEIVYPYEELKKSNNEIKLKIKN